MKPQFFVLALVAIALVGLAVRGGAGDGPGEVSMLGSNADRQLSEDFEAIEDTRIFFNHMSVGDNIMHGVKRIGQGRPLLRYRHLDLARGDRGEYPPAFTTANGGENRKPKTKVDAFKKALDGSFEREPEIALMKFCYVDFNGSTNVQEIFDYYSEAVEEIRSKHRELVIVHVTTPLAVKDPLWKDTIKEATGYKDETAQANIRRHEYNELVRKHFADEPVFDLAHYESLREGGATESFSRSGKEYPSLVPEYASDGRHLNEDGADWVARQLIHSLAEITRSKRNSTD